MSRRDSQALAEIVAWIAGRPRPRLRSSAARFDEKSDHTADPAVRAGIAGSTADLGAEIVADGDADKTVNEFTTDRDFVAWISQWTQ